MKLLSPLIACLALLTTTASNAQESFVSEMCFASVIPALVEGDYNIEAGPLHITISGNSMIGEAKQTGTGKIYPGNLRQFMMRMTPPIPDFRIEETDALQPTWFWAPGPGAPGNGDIIVGSEDIETLFACRIEDFPRFIGTFQTTAQTGETLHHTIRLVLIDNDWLIGAWRFETQSAGHPVIGLRYINMIRTSEYTGP